jgi:hypothetical protein
MGALLCLATGTMEVREMTLWVCMAAVTMVFVPMSLYRVEWLAVWAGSIATLIAIWRVGK